MTWGGLTSSVASPLGRHLKGRERMQIRLYELFRQLHFPRSAAAVYCSLLIQSPMNETDLRRDSGEDGSSLKNALTFLESMRLIGNDLGCFYAAEPSLAWLSIIADHVWGQQTTLAPIHELPSLTDPKSEITRQICEELGTVAKELYKPYAAVRRHKVLDADNADQLALFTCEIISRAQKEIVAISKSPRSPQLSSFWAVLTDRLDNHGAQYRRIADLYEIEEHGLKIVRRDISDHGIDLRVMEQRRIGHEFYAVDGRYVAITHQRKWPANEPRRGVGRITNYLDVVRRYCVRFERYASDAIPAPFVVDRLETAAQRLIRRARATLPGYIVSWLQDIVDYGKFSKFHETEGWPREKTIMVVSVATAAGMVKMNPYGELVPSYGVSEDELRRAFSMINTIK